MKNTVLALLCVVLGSGFAFAGDKSTSSEAGGKAAKEQTLSKEQREKLAGAHSEMAACLRTDKPFGECQSQMMSACKEAGGCPMMGMKHGKKKGMRSGEAAGEYYEEEKGTGGTATPEAGGQSESDEEGASESDNY